MNTAVEKLLPDNAYWKYFLQICAIPHISGHEEKLRDFLVAEAQKYALQCRVDKAGNLAIDRPAAPGYENNPVIILQAHLDMVPQAAEGVEFDFLNDAVTPMVEGDWVTTGGRTTLGADDGMGVALAMELLTDQTLQCGPLRAVFTVSEETGLGGAEDIDLEFLDADVLFNLDSDVTFTIGCAGGSRFMGSQKLSVAAPEANTVGLRFYLSGMQGGHSGVDIHRNVGSACRVMGDFLRDMTDMGFAISQVKAGTLHNAIAREAECSGAIAESELEKVAELVKAYNTLLNTQFEPAPGGQIVLTVEKIPAPNEVLTPDAQEKLLTVWDALPHGLLSVCPDGSVETSSNLAVVEGSCGSDWSFTLLVRSLYDAQREKVTGEALELLHANGFAGEVDSAYTSWEPKWDSPLLEMACAIYRDVMNKEPEKFVIHGGLEPGMFCGMNPKLQMLSFAPATQAVHSPQEKLSISDSEAVRKLLRALVERIREL